VVQILAHEIPGIPPVTPEAGKVARAAAVSSLIEAGNVYLPHPLYAPWVNDFIEECAAFPNGRHDDKVDAMTQALLRWNMLPCRQVVRYDVYDQMTQISPY
jgi:predicted phage terminase large subunit-like protein